MAMTEQRATAPEPSDESREEEVEYPAAQEVDGARDSVDDANALRFTEEEQLIQAQIRRHREESERRKKEQGKG
ncbi:hypothetical protein SCMU_35080 [Sinomonas cyclohexanicum]|uniref:Uncharacterized protein n=2 Tax=Sinomonas cyclohexanicum TaxID=322009 RepID=A0ABM7PZC8_SINCY|nr:hypothetical protein SCMU_35080 [Corynebacterium cyclohexanicum]